MGQDHCFHFTSGFTEAQGLPRLLSGKESASNAGDTGDVGSIPGQENPLEEGTRQLNPRLLSGESHGQRSLTGGSP